ncbi:MAG: hypothetical protein K0S27_1129 [Gammaproteobacteria bacterium]|jgi:uncharacterized membrane protein YfcA|nr:hypothetical protein [Gammaproteobacteria bacterium]
MTGFVIHHSLIYVLFITGLFAGTVDAIAGGGGLISLPILLGVGIPPHLALGTNKLQSMVGTAVAMHTYYRQGWIKREGLWRGLLFSFWGAFLGAVISQVLSGGFLKKLIPFLLIGVLFYIILSPRLGQEDKKPKMKESHFYAIFGTLLGLYDGFLGPGAGAFWIFVLVFCLGQNLLRATAYTKVFNLNTNIAAFLCFALGGNVDYSLALCMITGQLIGGRLGARLAIRQGAKLVRPLFILVVSITMMTLIFKNYKEYFIIIKFQQIKEILGIISIIITVAIIGFWSKYYVTNKKDGIS